MLLRASGTRIHAAQSDIDAVPYILWAKDGRLLRIWLDKIYLI